MVNWLEVEAKVRVDDVKEMRKEISKIASFNKKEKRGDDYFALQSRGYPKKSFRIRNDGKKMVVNFKRPLKSLYRSGVVVKREYEFELKDKKHLDNFLALLREFGFKEWVKKKKHTESYRYKKDNNVVIELNKVEHVGTYMEVEYLARGREVEKARKKVLEVLKELGVKKSEIDNTGYTKRLYQKGAKGKKDFIVNGFKG